VLVRFDREIQFYVSYLMSDCPRFAGERHEGFLCDTFL